MANINEKDSDGFQDRVVCINRVAKVVKGGRRFSFSALGSEFYGLEFRSCHLRILCLDQTFKLSNLKLLNFLTFKLSDF